MNMPITASQAAKLFVSKVGKVSIIYENERGVAPFIPAIGKYVVVEIRSRGLYSDDGEPHILTWALVYDISVYNNRIKCYFTSLRVARRYSGKPRWRINHRLAAEIRRAVHYVE